MAISLLCAVVTFGCGNNNGGQSDAATDLPDSSVEAFEALPVSELFGLVRSDGYSMTWIDPNEEPHMLLLEKGIPSYTEDGDLDGGTSKNAQFSELATLEGGTIAFIDSDYLASEAAVYRVTVILSNGEKSEPTLVDSSVKSWTFIRVFGFDNYWGEDGPSLDDTQWQSMYDLPPQEDPNFNFVVLGDGLGDEGSFYGYIGENGNVVEQIPEENTGDPGTLTAFFHWALEHFPGQRYALSYWGHGSGALGRVQEPVPLSIAPDATDDDELTAEETADALHYLAAQSGRPIDIFFLCACVSQMIENVYPLEGAVRYVVAGESVVGCGADLLVSLYAAPEKSPGEIAKDAVASQEDTVYERDVVFSSVDIEETARAVELLDILASDLRSYRDASSQNAALLEGALSDAQDMEYYVEEATYLSNYVDIGDLCLRIEALGDAALADSARAVREHLESSLVTSTVVVNDDEALYENARGLSIYHPTAQYPFYDSLYGTLSFATDTQWDEYISSWSF